MDYVAAAEDIHRHMLQQIAALEQEKKEQGVLDERLLKKRILQDQKVDWVGGGVHSMAVGGMWYVAGRASLQVASIVWTINFHTACQLS